MTREDARWRARLREPSPAAPPRQNDGRHRHHRIQTAYSEPTRVAVFPVAEFSPLLEPFWWLWCHLVWAWQQLVHWLATLRQGAPVVVIDGVIDGVLVGDAAFDAYQRMGLFLAAEARATPDYHGHDDREDSYYRVTPVVITLIGGQVIHFCEYQMTDRPVPSNASYFAGLNGMRMRAAGWRDGEVFSAWGLRLEGYEAAQTVYIAQRARNFPEPLDTLLTRRTEGFSQLMSIVGVAVGTLVLFAIVGLLGGEFDLEEAGILMALITGVFLSVPVLFLIVYALIRLMAGPLRSIPEMMAAGEYGNRHLRLRSFDFGRCERAVFEALERHEEN